MRFLFSPIGTADPLTTLGDGPMLHIVRHYKPERIMLFLSPAMAKFQDEDARYTEAIERLCKLDGREEPSVELIRSSRTDVQHFDAYIADFEKILRDLRKKNKRAEILVNVSSGTPAMEQALVALGAFGEYGLTLLQVSTPRRDMNRGDDRENPNNFDLDTLWELNPDNAGKGSASRIEEVALPNFQDRLLIKNIISLILAYDYEAALLLARQAKGISSIAIGLIERTISRLNINQPVAGEALKLQEYLWMLEVRMKQGHWADYVRALTPAYTWTAVRLLDRNGLPPARYLKVKKHRDGTQEVTDKLNLDKVMYDEDFTSKLSKRLFHTDFYIKNWMLNDLVNAYCPADIASPLSLVRTFEEGNRNALAHEIVPASKEEIEQRGEATFEEVMDTLFSLNGVKPGKYDETNKQIVSLL